MRVPIQNLRSCLEGGAAGDCIGGPLEGRPPGESELPVGPWRISDDTILSLATARALVGAEGVTPEGIAASFVEAFEGGIAGLGASTLKALRDLKAGVHWALAGRRGEHAAGNGAAMRIAPLAFYLDAKDPSERRTVRDVCRITHHNDEAYVAALSVLLAMQEQAGWGLGDVAETLPDTKVRDALLALAALPAGSSVATAAECVGTSGYAPESVPLALFIAASAESLESGIFAAVGCGGDTDTIASIVGQIMGARGGVVPSEWARVLPCRRQIEEVCVEAQDAQTRRRVVRRLEELCHGEFALIAVDPSTGVPLDANGNWAMAGEKEFLCFSSEEEAEAYAALRLRERSGEWILFAYGGAQTNVFRRLDS